MGDQLNSSSLQESILNTLAYYDIFNYPLKPEEVLRFVSFKNAKKDEVEQALNSLCNLGLIFKFNEFYSLQNDINYVKRRLKGNGEAEKYFPLARKKAGIIMRFPFVRAVMASGSLSKGYMDENSDLDFFIVTASGRLWIARTLLILYKRIFLFNSHKYFCVNYFIDEDHLEIEEKNLFTATELATVIPLCGVNYYSRLHKKNMWLRDFFPNYCEQETTSIRPPTSSPFKKILEEVIDFCAGTWLNALFMRITLNRWKRLYQSNYAEVDFEIAFKTRKHSSKNHPKNYQKKVIELYEGKLRGIREKFSFHQKVLQ